MTCQFLSDRMPMVSLGQATWSDEEHRHLEGCSDCAAEWRVVEQASRITAATPPGFDPAHVSARVLHRLSTEPVRASRAPRGWLAAAGVAAAGLILALLLPDRGGTAGPIDPEAGWTMPVMGLDSLNEEQLRLVLESIDEPLETPTQPMMPSMIDLDDQQLERLIRSLEG